MAILDTLTVQLLMNADGLVKGAKEAQEGLTKTGNAVEKTGKSLDEVGKKGADSFAAFRREALGAIALFTGGAGIAAFTQDIAAANTALGSLSRQLDIAPQKLTQLHEAAKAAGVNPGDVDGFLKGIQSKASTNEGLAQLNRLSQLTGVDFIDANGKVRADVFDQFAHSKQFQSLNRGVQDNYIQQLNGTTGITNLVDRPDYDALQKRFAGLGPTPEQIRQGEQLLSDWTELKANTDQVMQQVFSDLEPSIHNFLQALIALEKSHPKEIAEDIAGVAAALSVLSAILTAKSFVKALGLVSSIGNVAGVAGRLAAGTGGAVTAGIAGAVAHDVKETGHSPWGYTGAADYWAEKAKEGKDGPTRTDLENHYLQRTGSLTTMGIDWDKERAIWQKESPEDRKKLEDEDTKRRWDWVHDSLDWIKGALLPNANAEPHIQGTDEVRSVRNDQIEAPVSPANPSSQDWAQHFQWTQPQVEGKPDGDVDFDRLAGAVAMQESHGDPNAYNRKSGAAGEFQFVPSTYRWLGGKNPYDPEEAWRIGQKYLRMLHEKYHDTEKALAAYNWGPGNLDKNLKAHGDQWRSWLPSETSDYLYKVGRNYQTGNVVHHNTTTHSPTVNVVVNGGSGSPDEIRRMAHKGVTAALERHDAGKVG